MNTDQYEKAPYTTSIDASTHTYNDPTPGLMDLKGLDEISLSKHKSVTHYDIKGYNEETHIFSIAIAEAPNSELYISDVWVDEQYRGNGIGTELVKITNKISNNNVYLYASTAEMKHIVNKLGWIEFHEEWYKKIIHSS